MSKRLRFFWCTQHNFYHQELGDPACTPMLFSPTLPRDLKPGDTVLVWAQLKNESRSKWQLVKVTEVRKRTGRRGRTVGAVWMDPVPTQYLVFLEDVYGHRTLTPNTRTPVRIQAPKAADKPVPGGQAGDAEFTRQLHEKCVTVGYWLDVAHTHVGQTGFWAFPSEVEDLVP